MSDSQPLREDEVHVWTVLPEQVRAGVLIARYHSLMNEAERRKQARFAFPKGRHECLVTRALVRTTLSRYADVAPEDWRFEANDHGRPYLAAGQCALPLHFNLSHTDGLIACAVTLGREVGVDVEFVDRKNETVSIADRFFSPVEVQELRRLPESRQRDRFFDYWTLKESYIKARGKGLAIPLEQFSFHLGESQPIRISFDPRLPDDPARWQFALWTPLPRHRMAVGVVRGVGSDLKITVRSTIPLLPDGES